MILAVNHATGTLPGRLLLSEDVYRQLRSRPDLILTDLGTRSVKGYDDPLRVYDLEPTQELARSLLREAAAPEATSRTARAPRYVRPTAIGITVGILTFVALGVWTALGPGSSVDSGNTLDSGSALDSDARDTTMAAVAERPLPGGAGTGSTSTLGAGSTPNLETPTRIPEADYLVLRGRRELASGTPVGTARAAEIFTRAIELAPDYAPAHLGLAEAQIELGKTGARPLAVVLPQVRAHLDDALRHDPDLGPAHAALATFLAVFQWDWEGAEREFETALELAPTPAVHRAFAELLSALGRHDDALTQVAMALRREPGTAANAAAQGMTLFRARNYAEARAVLGEALRLDPTDDQVRVHLARTQEALGERQEARRTLEGADPASRNPYVQLWRARLRVAGGRERARGDQLARTLRGSLPSAAARNPDAPYYLAALRLSLGDPAGALGALQRAMRTPSPSLIWLPTDPMWDAARSAPQFQRLVRRIEAGQRAP